jgi:ferredoxin
LIEAQDWYEREVTGLGRRFRQATDAVIDCMIDNPRQLPLVFKNVRGACVPVCPVSAIFARRSAGGLRAKERNVFRAVTQARN